MGGGRQAKSPEKRPLVVARGLHHHLDPEGICPPFGPKTDSRPSGDDPHVREGTRI